ncbi:MAG: peptidylprolyl isomerase [Bryobacteraceae bacterium]
MFSFFRNQQKMTRYLLGGLMLVLAASMLTYLTNTGFTTTTDGDMTLAEVAGTNITTVQAQASIDRLMRGGQLPPEAMEAYFPQIVQQLVDQKALLHEAERLGLTASDEEVLIALAAAFPQFFQDGKLSNKDQFEAALAQQNLTMQDAADTMRDQLMLRKIQNLALSSVVISSQDVDRALLQKHEKAKVEYIAFPPAKFRDQVKVTPEEVKAAYEKTKATYTMPERRSFQVLLADQVKVEQSITVSDAQLRQTYSASMDNFRMPERVEARHILLMTQGKPETEKKAALTKAQDLLKQVKAGGDFAALAKANSQDPGSAVKGGDLGFIVRGQTVPEFEKFVFSAKPKDISDIVTTEYGYHIIQVMSKEAARVKPFEEVKEQLTEELKKQNVNEKMQQMADQAHAALLKTPGSAAEVAKQYGLELFVAKDLAPGDVIPGLGAAPEIDGALAAMKANEVSAPVFMANNRVAVVVFGSRVASRPAEFAEVQARVQDQLINGKANDLAEAAAKTVATRISGGEALDQVARSLKLDVTKSAEFTRADSVDGLGPAAYLSDVFVKRAGTVVGPIPVQGRNIVYKIVERQTPDIKDFAGERDGTITDLKQQKARVAIDLLTDSVVNKLRDDGKLKVHEDTVKRMAASYRPNR